MRLGFRLPVAFNCLERLSERRCPVGFNAAVTFDGFSLKPNNHHFQRARLEQPWGQ